MNYIDYSQLGGFPLTQDILDFIQKEYIFVAKALGSYMGQSDPMSPVFLKDPHDPNNPNVANDSYIAFAGTVYPFKGGTIQTYITAKSKGKSLIYEDGSVKNVIAETWFEFGQGISTQTFLYSDIPVLIDPVDIHNRCIALANSISSLQNSIDSLAISIDNVDDKANQILSMVNNHIINGGHPWNKITNTPIIDVGSITFTDQNTNDYQFMVSGKSYPNANYAVVLSLDYSGNSLGAGNNASIISTLHSTNGFTISLNDDTNNSGHLMSGTISYIVYQL